MKRSIQLGLIMGALGALGPVTAGAAAATEEKTYQMTGRVSRVTSDVIEVEGAEQRLVLPRTSAVFKDNAMKPGDEVNLWYSITPRKVEVVAPRGAAGQQPGQVVPSDPGQVIEDDRLFLDAKNRSPSPKADHPHS